METPIQTPEPTEEKTSDSDVNKDTEIFDKDEKKVKVIHMSAQFSTKNKVSNCNFQGWISLKI